MPCLLADAPRPGQEAFARDRPRGVAAATDARHVLGRRDFRMRHGCVIGPVEQYARHAPIRARRCTLVPLSRFPACGGPNARTCTFLRTESMAHFGVCLTRHVTRGCLQMLQELPSQNSSPPTNVTLIVVGVTNFMIAADTVLLPCRGRCAQQIGIRSEADAPRSEHALPC
jgi:hypothetical protein